MPRATFILLFILVTATAGLTQTFSSGSTGADGVLNCTQPGTTTVQLPASGILNYTTVNVALSCTLQFAPNLTNTPVTMLASGAVIISGTIALTGGCCGGSNPPAPGGFYGGTSGQNGVGPGGGIYGKSDGTQNARWVGPLSLVPIVGGSGGAGPSSTSGQGGGGGGAIVIASSTSITVTGMIRTDGGPGYNGSGSGANGAIRLVSNSINVSGQLYNASIVRIEAPSGAVSYTGSGTPPVVATINPIIVPVNVPSIAIALIGGYAAPSNTTATFKTIDLLLPTQLPDPIAVVVQGTNLPPGAQVTLSFSGSQATTNPPAAVLSGSSSATFLVSGLSRTSVTVIFAIVSFNANLVAGNLRQSGDDAVAKVELAAAMGQPTKYRFLRADGSEVALAKVTPELKHIFGM